MISLNQDLISDSELEEALRASIEGLELKKVLILPPDYTRMYSGAGKITAIYHRLLRDKCQVDIMPALGTHVPVTREESLAFFGDEIDPDSLIAHNWRTDVVKIGEVPGEFVSEVSEGLVRDKIDVEVNRRLTDPSYDLIISVGQVVPHEVVGMANYSKNIFVGCGGSSMINSSHMLGAFYGMERVLGRDFSPVRRVFDYAEEHFLKDVPLLYVLTVTTNKGDETLLHGLYIGRSRELYESAVAHSQGKNMTEVKRPFKRVVVNLDPREFKTTWLGNKAIYRTRMAIADKGELIVLAGGVKGFGEDSENDRLIRKFGYTGRENILKLAETEPELKANLSVAAHLIHGSSDGRFSVAYATKYLSEQEIRSVGYDYLSYDEAIRRYNPDSLTDGYHTDIDGTEFFYISNPALGLWHCGLDNNTEYVDLHTHSTFSDGSDSPSQLVSLASREGLKAIALTDHDCLDGLEEAIAQAEKLGVELVPAFEISCKYKRLCHIIGMFVDYQSEELLEFTRECRTSREKRNQAVVKRLNELGYKITMDEVTAVAGSDNISRAHFGRVLTEKGYAQSIPQAFNEILGKGCPAYVERAEPLPEEAIAMIHRARGIAVFAHPHISCPDTEELREMLKRLKLAGLDAMECIYSDYTVERISQYKDLAQEFGLAASGGTDYHGAMKPHISIGTGTREKPIRVPYSILRELKKLKKD